MIFRIYHRRQVDKVDMRWIIPGFANVIDRGQEPPTADFILFPQMQEISNKRVEIPPPPVCHGEVRLVHRVSFYGGIIDLKSNQYRNR
jgi:hypothetical protein